MEKIVFENNKLVPEKLLQNGFRTERNGFAKETDLLDKQFLLRMFVDETGCITTELIDTAGGEEYVLHLVEDCCGAFVAQVRQTYRETLQEVCDRCYETEHFKQRQTGALTKYITETYGAQPEYLWEKTPDCFIFRRSDNKKWFAAVLTVKRDRLGLAGNAMEEIVDFRVDPAELAALIDNERYFAGYHMNKKHWATVILNGSVPQDELFGRIDASYRIAKG